MTIWIARHGESSSNAGFPTRSPEESPLTEVGRRQAAELARQFDLVDRVVTSTYARSRQTGAEVTRHFRSARSEEWEGIQEWSVLDTSKYSGTTASQRAPAVERVVGLNDPDYVDGSGAESFHQVLGRVDDFVQRCRELPRDETVLVVSHGRFVQAVLWSLARLEPRPVGGDGMRSFWSFARSFELGNGQRILMRDRFLR